RRDCTCAALRPESPGPLEATAAAAVLPVDEVDAREYGRELCRSIDLRIGNPRKNIVLERSIGARHPLGPAVDEAHRQQLEVASRQRVVDGLHRRALLEVPARGARV